MQLTSLKLSHWSKGLWNRYKNYIDPYMEDAKLCMRAFLRFVRIDFFFVDCRIFFVEYTFYDLGWNEALYTNRRRPQTRRHAHIVQSINTNIIRLSQPERSAA